MAKQPLKGKESWIAQRIDDPDPNTKLSKAQIAAMHGVTAQAVDKAYKRAKGRPS